MESGTEWSDLKVGDWVWLEERYLDCPPTLMEIFMSPGGKAMRALLFNAAYNKTGYFNDTGAYRVTLAYRP